MVENWSNGGFKHNSWDNNLGMPSLTGFTKAVWSHFLALKESNILSFIQILLQGNNFHHINDKRICLFQR